MDVGANGDVLVIGVGNDCRSDDGVGLVVARRLSEMGLRNVSVMETSGEGTVLLEAWRDADKAILVDAVSSGSEPGTIHRVVMNGLETLDIPAGVSTHGFGVGEAVRLAQAMGRLPPRLVIYGIEGRNFGFGFALSPEVEAALGAVAAQILEELKCTSTP